MLEYWLLGLAMMLLIEGLLPLLLPALWRDGFAKLVTLKDGQLRFIGLASILSGVLMLYWLN